MLMFVLVGVIRPAVKACFASVWSVQFAESVSVQTPTIYSQVIGASIDSQFTHLAWINTPKKEGGLGGALDIPLVADLTKEVSEAYGVMLEGTGHTCRGLFVISDTGVVRHITMNDPPVGRNVDEVLRLVQAYQFADKHGEVCPVNWKPGKATVRQRWREGETRARQRDTRDAQCTRMC